jgi:hypothetical protein
MTPAEDFAHVAELLRTRTSEHGLRAVLSNNVNTILAALDIAAGGVPPVAGETCGECPYVAAQIDQIVRRTPA